MPHCRRAMWCLVLWRFIQRVVYASLSPTPWGCVARGSKRRRRVHALCVLKTSPYWSHTFTTRPPRSSSRPSACWSSAGDHVAFRVHRRRRSPAAAPTRPPPLGWGLPAKSELGGGGALDGGREPARLPRGCSRRARSSPLLLELVFSMERRQLFLRRLERPTACVKLRQRLEAARRLLSRYIAPVGGLVGVRGGGLRTTSGSAGRPVLLRSELAAQQAVLGARAQVLLLRVVDLPPIESEHTRLILTRRRREESISQRRWWVAPRCSTDRSCRKCSHDRDRPGCGQCYGVGSDRGAGTCRSSSRMDAGRGDGRPSSARRGGGHAPSCWL